MVVVFLSCSLWVRDSRLKISNAGAEFEAHNSAFYLYAAIGMRCCLNEVAQIPRILTVQCEELNLCKLPRDL